MRALLEAHPVYIDPMSSLAGGWMLDLTEQRPLSWNPDIPYEHLRAAEKLYGLDLGIGAQQHFCPDYTIGLRLGWGGLLRKVRRGRAKHPDRALFFTAEEDVILGAQNLIRDFFTGIALLIEDAFTIGDRVTIAGVTGEVVEIVRVEDDCVYVRRAEGGFFLGGS
ncbi:MAG: mechanosensitive ion channel family protein [Anaerolineae bacterium]|nr:mechanosensitive ion channel family protein [Anaerolineae bacterium]